MPHLREKETYYIGPDWKGIVVTGICVVISGYCTATGVKVVYPKIDMWFLLLISLLTLFTQCKSYELYNDGVATLLFGIRIRKVLFSCTSSIVLIDDERCKYYAGNCYLLIFVTSSCSQDIKESNSALLYLIKHPSSVLPIKVPKISLPYYIKLVGDLSGMELQLI